MTVSSIEGIEEYRMGTEVLIQDKEKRDRCRGVRVEKKKKRQPKK
jgi:hypothetical protein